MRRFESDTNPHESERKLFTKRAFEIQEGFTVLVGANGTGKTTTLDIIKRQLIDNDIPVLAFDNLRDGGTTGLEGMLQHGHIGEFATGIYSSEGERIVLNLGNFAQYKLSSFIKDGVCKNDHNSIRRLLREMDGEKLPPIPPERWVLFDATDSGLSIDNIIQVKRLISAVIEDGKKNGLSIYFVVTANDYEMVAGESCFDVRLRKYVKFADYNEFRDFIIKSGEKKEQSVRVSIEAAKKKREKEEDD